MRNLLAISLAIWMGLAGAAAQETVQMTTGLVGDAGDRLGRLYGLVIGIDPGHQGQANYDREPIAPGSSQTKPKVSTGTQGALTKTPEHAVNLEISFKLRDALIKEGARAVMTRESADVDISNVERAEMMNRAQADLVLRLHCNGVDSPSPHGMALYVRKTGVKARESDLAAREILSAMVAETGAQNRGVVHSDEYSGLNWSQVPSILVEMGFLTNPSEEALLLSPEYQDKLVSGMIEGIARYFAQPSETEEAPEQFGE